MQDQSDTVLVLDAFDEDSDATVNAEARIKALMAAASDFLAVIITCRSQFFADDASIPQETGVAVVGLRRLGETGYYKFYKLYLVPFNQRQIQSFIASHFPLWEVFSFSLRRRAQRLLADVPELAVRPMLLALIPELAREREKRTELYELYGFMIEQWSKRESRWIPPSELFEISKAMAAYIYAVRGIRFGDRISPEDLRNFGERYTSGAIEWRHLTARSLLNRDGEGNYKFSHRSILEYLVVAAAVDGYDECLEVPWTALMKDLFLSWGRTADGAARAERAKEILKRDFTDSGLYPLAVPLPSPRALSAGSLARVGHPSGSMTERRRLVPPEWRGDSLRLEESEDVIHLLDLIYDLTWRIVRHDGPAAEVDQSILRYTWEQLSIIDSWSGGFRLPSIEEFASLVEAQEVIRRGLIDMNDLYWLGDRRGRSGYLVVTGAQAQIPSGAIRPLGPRIPIRFATGSLQVYEVSRSHAVRGSSFSARAVQVTRGIGQVAGSS